MSIIISGRALTAEEDGGEYDPNTLYVCMKIA
jgi:hypothetical protein